MKSYKEKKLLEQDRRQIPLSIELTGIKITPTGEIEDIIIQLKYFSGIIIAQPGLPLPSENISANYLNTPGAIGCTDEAMVVSDYCKKHASFGYILSNKKLDDLKKAYLENKANAEKENKSNPLTRLTLLSDPAFAFAIALGGGPGFMQEIDSKPYYKRFAVILKNGKVEEIFKHEYENNLFITPAEITANLLAEQREQATAVNIP